MSDPASLLEGLLNDEPEPEPEPKPKPKPKPIQKPREKREKPSKEPRASKAKQKPLLTTEMVYRFICEKAKTGETGWLVLKRVIERNSRRKQKIKNRDIALLTAIIEITRKFVDCL